MFEEKRKIIVLYLNTYGQTKFTVQKQLQIEEIIRKYNCDIIHLQESHTDEESFEMCSYIKNNYNIQSEKIIHFVVHFLLLMNFVFVENNFILLEDILYT